LLRKVQEAYTDLGSILQRKRSIKEKVRRWSVGGQEEKNEKVLGLFVGMLRYYKRHMNYLWKKLL